MTPASIYRIRRVPPYTVGAAQVVVCAAVIAMAWSSMVLGAVLVARHAFDAARSRACVDYGPRVTHGPAQVVYRGTSAATDAELDRATSAAVTSWTTP